MSTQSREAPEHVVSVRMKRLEKRYRMKGRKKSGKRLCKVVLMTWSKGQSFQLLLHRDDS